MTSLADLRALAERLRLALMDDFRETFDEGVWRGAVRIVRWFYPPFLFWRWFCVRWIGHDCDMQPRTCRAEWLFRVPHWVWLDV